MNPITASTISCAYNLIKWLKSNNYDFTVKEDTLQTIITRITIKYYSYDKKGKKSLFCQPIGIGISIYPDFTKKTVNIKAHLISASYTDEGQVYFNELAEKAVREYGDIVTGAELHHIKYLKDMIENFDGVNIIPFGIRAKKYTKLEESLMNVKSMF